MPQIRLALADDHETVREGLKAIFSAQEDFEIVGEASDGQAAVTLAQALRPTIVIMDVSMPVLNGLKATETIIASCPGVKVLVLSRHGNEGFVKQLLHAGASGYVLKQSTAAELVSAVRTVASGRRYLDPMVSRSMGGEPSRQRVATTPPAPNPLSPREEEILRLVAWGNSNKEIAAQLELSIKTVETHRANASQKLSLRHRIDIVRFALLRGWLDVA